MSVAVVRPSCYKLAIMASSLHHLLLTFAAVSLLTTAALSGARADALEAVEAAPTTGPRLCSGELCFEPGLRVRLRYDAVDDDPSVAHIGRSDGFGLSSARLKLRGDLRELLGFNVSLEGGFVDPADTNMLAGSTFGALKDAYLELRALPFLQLRAGQLKVPFHWEAWRSTAAQRFTDASVGARGVRIGEGYQRRGVSPPRDLGLMLGATELRLGPVGLLYLLSITNGNGSNQAFNDNSWPALHGRVALSLGDWLTLGGGGLYNHRTLGVIPDQFDEADAGFTVDLQAAAFGLFAAASGTWIWTAYPTTGEATSLATTAAVEGGYQLWFGLGLGYRFAWYEPKETARDDAVFEHTLGLRYDVPRTPLTLVMDYTFALEERGRELRNDRLVGVLQLDF